MKDPTFINENLSIHENDGSLAFGTDAYLLAAYLRKEPKAVACELGAGSGVISLLAMAREKFHTITAIEIQKKIAELAALNVEKNGFSGKIQTFCGDIRTIFEENPTFFGAFDTVFTNPPYMRTNSGMMNADDADAASRHEVYGGISDFAIAANKLLRYGGKFYVVYRPDRLSELISACLAVHLEPKRLTLVYPTEKHAPCIVLLEAKKGAAPGIFVTRPLVIYQKDAPMTVANYTPEMNEIYEKGAFHESYQKP